MLPILNHRSAIIDAVERNGKLIVIAPPGTGKSTQIPQFLAGGCSPEKMLLVLEPRRIAARALAGRVAREMGGESGGEVGYQVRFERVASDRTRILFLTYGAFLQLLQADPQASFASTVLFDEFHERSFDADIALAWVRRLTETVRPDLKLLVLSATLDAGALQAYVPDCGVVTVSEKAYPVDISYQSPRPRERLADQVDRCLAGLPAAHEGSALVFLPGVYEIERAAETIAEQCRRRGFRILPLHGRMPLADQQRALALPESEQCVILSTNVAETSLTIPGVTAVVDSGLARTAAWDPERGRNTLYLGRITRQNARQRAGRAGRLTRGICIRLWGREDEAAMAPYIIPEALRLDPAAALCTLCNLQTALASDKTPGFAFPATIPLLTPPPPERWAGARDELVRCGAIDPARAGIDPSIAGEERLPLYPLTVLGRAMSRLPLDPPIAAVLLQRGSTEKRRILTAMAALWENVAGAASESRDLFDMAAEFLADKRDPAWGRDAAATFDQLQRLLREGGSPGPGATGAENELRRDVTATWLRVFSHRIAVRQERGTVYTMADGRTARLMAGKPAAIDDNALPDALLALMVHEQAGRGQAKKAVIPLFLPLDADLIAEAFPGEVRRTAGCRWDDQRLRAVAEETVTFRNLPLRRREVEAATGRYARHIADCLAAKLTEGIWDWRADDPKAAQFVCRVRAVAAAYPEMNIPRLIADDWELIFHDLCMGKSSLNEIKGCSIAAAVRSYLGPQFSRFVESKAPDVIVLPSGRKGRVTWSDNAPPELSARLGDLIGSKERFTLMDGRVQGVFDILAPNHRTVQKTADLGSFWKNTYPQIKRELQRKYPKHPWP